MIVISKLLHAIVFACIVSTGVIAQATYSESNPFERKLPSNRKDKDSSTSKPSPVPATEPGSVLIPVSVFDSTGTPVSGLEKEHFTVLIDGVPTAVESFEKPTSLPNVVIVLDMSPSAFKRIEDIRLKARDFALELPPGTKVMVAEFHSQMNIRSQLTDDRDEIEKAISNTKVGDGTSLYTAVQTLSQKVLPSLVGKTVVVLFTDGVDTTSTSGTYRSSVLEVGRADVSFYPIYYDTSVDTNFRSSRPRLDPFMFPPGTIPTRGIAGMSSKEYETGREYLEDLAAVSGGRLFHATKFDAAMKSLAAELRSKIYLRVPVSAADSRRSIRVRVSRPGLKVIARGAVVEK
jgi:VWFA-related protein